MGGGRPPCGRSLGCSTVREIPRSLECVCLPNFRMLVSFIHITHLKTLERDIFLRQILRDKNFGFLSLRFSLHIAGPELHLGSKVQWWRGSFNQT